MVPVADVPATIAFLRALEPKGPWLLVAINPNPDDNPAVRNAELGEFGPDNETSLIDWLAVWQGKWNLYFTSNLPAYAPFRTAKKDAVRQLRMLHVDVDLPGAADSIEESEHLLKIFRSISPAPTAIIFTGGGCQAIWLLAEKLSAAEHTHHVEAANTAIWTALNGDPCHDVSRLLRLPGTINMPNAKKRSKGRVPVTAYLVEADWTRTWSFKHDAIPALPDDIEPLPPSSPKKRGEDESGVVETLPSKLRKLIQTGDPKSFNNDRSRLGWHVMCELIRRGWFDADLSKIFLNPTNGISAHYLEQSKPQVYVTRNLKRARDAIALDWNRADSGAILTKDQANIDKALGLLGIKLSHDALADRVWMNGAGPLRRLSDEEIDAVWLKVQSHFSFLPDQSFFRTVFVVRARESSFHPVLDYLARNQPKWDNIHRIGSTNAPSWLTTYGGVEDTPYTRAVGRLTLVAAVRRMRQPGCKFDEMLMLIDPTQGTNKSTAVRTLAVNEDWFNDYLPIGEVGREVIEHVRGFWIIEAAELAGMSTREVERIKGFCSRQTDRGRMSYDRLVTDLPRSCVFIGTTNDDTPFTDLLNRRYWPTTILQEFDIDRMKRDLDQLWAEAAQAEAAGESIRLERSLWPAAAEVQARYRVEEHWATVLDHALGNLQGRITSVDLYKIINKHSGTVLHNDGRRLGRAMREIGFERKQYRDSSSPNPRWYYVRGDDYQADIYVFRDPIDGNVTVGNSPSSADVERQDNADDIPF